MVEGDSIYVFSDGYPDQFGGPKGKKYMLGKLKKLFLELSNHDLNTQFTMLEEELQSWMGENEQVDDILIIGMKFT